jgi:hypothetical protein
VAETKKLNCLEAIKAQSSRSPLSFLRSSPKFAFSTRLEVPNAATDLDSPILTGYSAGQLGANKPKLNAD